MGKEQRFLVIKTKDSKDITYFDYDKSTGYNIKPNPNLSFQDAINVKSMVLINPSLIEKMIDKKLKRRFDYLINLLSVVYEADDDTGEGLKLALNEAEKFRLELVSKYKSYIADEKYSLMLKKISILEDELYLRMQFIMNARQVTETRQYEQPMPQYENPNLYEEPKQYENEETYEKEGKSR